MSQSTPTIVLLGVGAAALTAGVAASLGATAAFAGGHGEHGGPADIAPPRGAHAGQCFAKVREPDAVVHESERVMVRPAGSFRKITPAVTRTIEKQVTVSAARTETVTHPAVYRTVWHTVTEPGRSYRVDTPARYETISRRVLIEAAHTVWRHSEGRPVYGQPYPGQVAYAATGEVLCRVLIPARYALTSERVLVSRGGHRVVQGASVTRHVAERVEVSPASVQHIPHAAVVRTVRETVVVAPARSTTVRTPPQYEVVDHPRSVPRYGWQPVVCDTPHPSPPPPPCCTGSPEPRYTPRPEAPPPYGERG